MRIVESEHYVIWLRRQWYDFVFLLSEHFVSPLRRVRVTLRRHVTPVENHCRRRRVNDELWGFPYGASPPHRPNDWHSFIVIGKTPFELGQTARLGSGRTWAPKKIKTFRSLILVERRRKRNNQHPRPKAHNTIVLLLLFYRSTRTADDLVKFVRPFGTRVGFGKISEKKREKK